MRYIEPIWERRQGESIQAFEAFNIYNNLGVKRSLKLVSEKTEKSKSCVSLWSVNNDWVRRVFAYECYISLLQDEEKENNLRKALRRHAETSFEFQLKAIAELENIDFTKLTPLQFIRVFEMAVNVERKALGLATVSEEIRLNQAQERLDLHKQIIESKTGENLEESTGFIEGLSVIGKDVWCG